MYSVFQHGHLMKYDKLGHAQWDVKTPASNCAHTSIGVDSQGYIYVPIEDNDTVCSYTPGGVVAHRHSVRCPTAVFCVGKWIVVTHEDTDSNEVASFVSADLKEWRNICTLRGGPCGVSVYNYKFMAVATRDNKLHLYDISGVI